MRTGWIALVGLVQCAAIALVLNGWGGDAGERRQPARPQLTNLNGPSDNGDARVMPVGDFIQATAKGGRTKNKADKAASKAKAGAKGAKGKAARTGPASLAVLPVVVKTGLSEDAGAGATLAEQIAGLVSGDEYKVVEQAELDELMDDRLIDPAAAATSQDEAAAFGKSAGIDYCVTATLTLTGGRKYLTARVVDTANNMIVGRHSAALPVGGEYGEAVAELASGLGLSADAPIEVRVSSKAPDDLDPLLDRINPQAVFGVRIGTADGRIDYVEGETIAFLAIVDEDAYITLIARGPDGNSTLLLPNNWSGEPQKYKAGELVEIPAPQAKFEFPIIEPFGPTLVKAIATKAPLPLSDAADLEKLLSDDNPFVDLGAEGTKAIGVRARAESGAISAAADWATAEITINTYSQREAQRDPEPPQEVQPTDPQPIDPVDSTDPEEVVDVPPGTDPNEAILDLWNKISAGDTQIQSMATSKGVAALGGGLFGVEELIVIRKPADGGGAKNIGKAGGEKGAVKAQSKGKAAKGKGKAGAKARPNFLAGAGEVEKVRVRGGEGFKALDATSIVDKIKELKKDPTVAAVIPNIRVQPTALPRTKFMPAQWAIKNRFNPGVDINWEPAADRIAQIPEDAMPLIGVVDTGINWDDPRLAAVCWTNPGEVADDGQDNDGNGLVDDVYGYNLSHDNNVLFNPQASFNHGSFCASVIACRETGANNDLLGIAPNAKIISAVALAPPAGAHPDEPAGGSYDSIRAAVGYAASQGATVINLSLGGQTTEQALAEAAQDPFWAELEAAGIILVVAAGNSAMDTDVSPWFPSCLCTKYTNIVSVCAVDAGGVLARGNNGPGVWSQFSNWGATTTHIAAPGSLILGVPKAEVTDMNYGTSFAAPMVTGAIALVRAAHPDWDHQTVIRAVLETARPLPALQGRCTTGGMLDVAAALEWQP